MLNKVEKIMSARRAERVKGERQIVETFLKDIKIEVILDIYAEILRKSGASVPDTQDLASSIKILSLKTVGFTAWMLSGGAYSPASRKIFLRLKDMKNFKSMNPVYKIRVLNVFVHELCHFLSKDTSFLNKRVGELFQATGLGGTLRKAIFDQSQGKSELLTVSTDFKHFHLALNEAMTQIITEMVLGEYFLRTGDFSKLAIEKGSPFPEKAIILQPYAILKLILRQIFQKLSENLGVPEEVIFKSFVKASFDDSFLFSREVNQLFTEIFGPEFLWEYSQLTSVPISASEIRGFLGKYDFKNLFLLERISAKITNWHQKLVK